MTLLLADEATEGAAEAPGLTTAGEL